jgi:hypothetical protein
LQLQEPAVARLTQQHNEVRSAGPAATMRINQMAVDIKLQEQALSNPEFANPKSREMLEGMIQQKKTELEGLIAAEQQRSAREAELASQLQAAQNRVADTRNRIAEMERALDAAIQQLSKR